MIHDSRVPVKAAREALASQRRPDDTSTSWAPIDVQTAVSNGPENPHPNAPIEFFEAAYKSLANFIIGLLPFGEDTLRPMIGWIEKSLLPASPQAVTLLFKFGPVPPPIPLQVGPHGLVIIVFVQHVSHLHNLQ